jgi:hypothetical protein
MPVEAIPDDPPAASQDPLDDTTGQPAETLDQSDVPSPEPAEFNESRRRSRAAPGITGSEPNRGGLLGGWLLFALVAAALLAGVVLGRQQIMAWAPESAALYALVGLAGEPPLPALPQNPLRFGEVTSDQRQVDGTPALVITGEIFNPTDQPQDVPPLVATLMDPTGIELKRWVVPPLVATLMDPTGIELKRWVFAAETEVLPPGGRVAFQTSTQNPPGQGDLNLYFVPQQR